MKKIDILASLALGLVLFTACDSDRDANPTYQDPTEFILDQPEGIKYDLEKETIKLTYSQPNYGFTAATYYQVEVATKENFEKFETLPTGYTKTQIAIPSPEIAEAATTLKVAEGKKESDFPMTDTLYFRVKAQLSEGQGVINSNIIALDSVKFYYVEPKIQLPTTMYAIGDFCGWKWEKAPAMIPFNDGKGGAEPTSGAFWKLIYIEGGQGLKFNQEKDWTGAFGFDDTKLIDHATAGLSKNEDNNIIVANSGWYLIVVRSAMNGNKVQYTVEFNEPAVYLFGEAAGGKWEKDEAWKFTIPTTADGFFVSPPFAANTDGIRATVVVDGFEWWKSEFMLFNGKIEYRGNGGDQDKVAGVKDQRLYFNFTDGTGKIE
ncbi:MAG: SusF/SusE family outer membrane protein [Phocaeicola sp.]